MTAVVVGGTAGVLALFAVARGVTGRVLLTVLVGLAWVPLLVGGALEATAEPEAWESAEDRALLLAFLAAITVLVVVPLLIALWSGWAGVLSALALGGFAVALVAQLVILVRLLGGAATGAAPGAWVTTLALAAGVAAGTLLLRGARATAVAEPAGPPADAWFSPARSG